MEMYESMEEYGNVWRMWKGRRSWEKRRKTDKLKSMRRTQ